MRRGLRGGRGAGRRAECVASRPCSGTADVFAGLLAGVTVIGYANERGKARALADVQAAAAVADLGEVTAALRPGSQTAPGFGG